MASNIPSHQRPCCTCLGHRAVAPQRPTGSCRHKSCHHRTETPLKKKNLRMASSKPHSQKKPCCTCSRRRDKPSYVIVDRDMISLQLLLGDPTFIDYFNVFLNLPVFGQRIVLSVNDQRFSFKEPLFAQTWDVSWYQVIKWLSKHRLPYFKASDLYLEYNLCLHLRNNRRYETRFFCLPPSGAPSTPQAFRMLMEKLLGHAMGMRMFRQSLNTTNGAQVFDCWLALEKLKNITNMEEHVKFRKVVAERYLQAGGQSKLQGLYPARAYLEFLNFKAAPDCVIEEEPDLFKFPPREIFAEAAIHVLLETKSIEILQKYLLHALTSYWAPRFVTFAAKALPGKVLTALLEDEGATVTENSLQECLTKLADATPQTLVDVKPSQSTPFLNVFAWDKSLQRRSNEHMVRSEVFEASQEPIDAPFQNVIIGQVKGPKALARRFPHAFPEAPKESESCPCIYIELGTQGDVNFEPVPEDDPDKSSKHLLFKSATCSSHVCSSPMVCPAVAGALAEQASTSKSQFFSGKSENMSSETRAMRSSGKKLKSQTLSALDGSMTCIAANEAIYKTSTPQMPISPTLSAPCDDRCHVAGQNSMFNLDIWLSSENSCTNPSSYESSFAVGNEVSLGSTLPHEMTSLLFEENSTKVTSEGRSKSRSLPTGATPTKNVSDKSVSYSSNTEDKRRTNSWQPSANASSTISYGGILESIPDEASVMLNLSKGSTTQTLSNLLGIAPFAYGSELHTAVSKCTSSSPALSCPCGDLHHYEHLISEFCQCRDTEGSSLTTETDDMADMQYPRGVNSSIPPMQKAHVGANRPSTWPSSPTHSRGHGKTRVAANKPLLTSVAQESVFTTPPLTCMAGGSYDSSGTSFTPVSLHKGVNKTKICAHMHSVPASLQAGQNYDASLSTNIIQSSTEGGNKSQTASIPCPFVSRSVPPHDTSCEASFEHMSAQLHSDSRVPLLREKLLGATSKVSQSPNSVSVSLHRALCQTQIPWCESKPHASKKVCIRSASWHTCNHPFINPEVIPCHAESHHILHQSMQRMEDEETHTIPSSGLSFKTKNDASFMLTPLHRTQSQSQIPWIWEKSHDVASEVSLRSNSFFPCVNILSPRETRITAVKKDTSESSTRQTRGTASPTVSVARFQNDVKSETSRMSVCLHRADGRTQLLSVRRTPTASPEPSSLSSFQPSTCRKYITGSSNVLHPKDNASSRVSTGTSSLDVRKESRVSSFCLHRSDGQTHIFSFRTMPSDVSSEPPSVAGSQPSKECLTMPIIHVAMPCQSTEGLPIKQDGSESSTQHPKDAASTRLSAARLPHDTRSDIGIKSFLLHRAGGHSRIVSLSTLPADLSSKASPLPSTPTQMASPRISTEGLLHDVRSDASQRSFCLHRANACTEFLSFGIRPAHMSTEASPLPSAQLSRECVTVPLICRRQDRSASGMLHTADMASPKAFSEGSLQDVRSDASQSSFYLHRAGACTQFLSSGIIPADASTEASPLPSTQPSRECVTVPLIHRGQDRSASGMAGPKAFSEGLLHNERSDTSQSSFSLQRKDVRTGLLSFASTPADMITEVSPIPNTQPSREYMATPFNHGILSSDVSSEGTSIRNETSNTLHSANAASPQTTIARPSLDVRREASFRSFCLHRSDGRTWIFSYGTLSPTLSNEVSPMANTLPSRENLTVPHDAETDSSSRSFHLCRTDARTQLLSFSRASSDLSTEVSLLPSVQPSKECMTVPWVHGIQDRSASVMLSQTHTASSKVSTEGFLHDVRSDASQRSFSLHRADAGTNLVSFARSPSLVSAQVSPMPRAQPSSECFTMPQIHRGHPCHDRDINEFSTPAKASGGSPGYTSDSMSVEWSTKYEVQDQDSSDLFDTLDVEDIFGIIQAFEEDSLWEEEERKMAENVSSRSSLSHPIVVPDVFSLDRSLFDMEGMGSSSSERTLFSAFSSKSEKNVFHTQESESSCSCSYDDTAAEVYITGLKESCFRPILPLPLRYLLDLSASSCTTKSSVDVAVFLGITCDKVAGSPFGRYLLSKHGKLLQQVLEFWEMTVEYLQASYIPISVDVPSRKEAIRNQLNEYLMKDIFPEILPETQEDLKQSLLTGRDVWYLEISRELVVQALSPEWHRFVQKEMQSINRDLFPDKRRDNHFSHLFISGVSKASLPSASLVVQELILTTINQVPGKVGKNKTLVNVTKNMEVPRYVTTLALNIAFHQTQSWLVDDFHPSVDLLPDRLESCLNSLYYVPMTVTRIDELRNMVPKKWKVANLRMKLSSIKGMPVPPQQEKKPRLSRAQRDSKAEEDIAILKMLKAANKNKPKNIENILTNDTHALLFRHMLTNVGESTLKMDFCQDVEELSFMMDRTLVEKTKAAIKQKYFQGELLDELKEIPDTILTKLKSGSEAIRLTDLEEAKRGVMADLEKKYFNDYIKSLPKNAKGLKLQQGTDTSAKFSLNAIQNAKRKKWQNLWKNVMSFIKSFSDPEECENLKQYIHGIIRDKEKAGEPKKTITEICNHTTVNDTADDSKKDSGGKKRDSSEEAHDLHVCDSHEHGASSNFEAPKEPKTYKGYVEVTSGGIEFILEKLTQDMSFMHEVRRYTALIDQLKDVVEAPNNQGFKPFGDVTSSTDIQIKKANVLIYCFLLSEYTPHVPINVTDKVAHQIEASFHQHGPRRQLFHKAYIQVFPGVYTMWKRYMRECRLNYVPPKENMNRVQEKTSRMKKASVFQKGDSETYKETRRSVVKKRSPSVQKGFNDVPSPQKARGSQPRESSVMQGMASAKKSILVIEKDAKEKVTPTNISNSAIATERNVWKTSDTQGKPTTSLRLPFKQCGNLVQRFNVAGLQTGISSSEKKAKATIAKTPKRPRSFLLSKKIALTSAIQSSNLVPDLSKSKTALLSAVPRGAVTDKSKGKKLPSTTNRSNNQARNQNPSMNAKEVPAPAAPSTPLRKMKTCPSSKKNPQRNTSNLKLVSTNMKDVDKRAPPSASDRSPQNPVTQHLSQKSIYETSETNRRNPALRKKAAPSAAALLTSLQKLMAPPLPWGTNVHKDTDEYTHQAQIFFLSDNKNVTSLITPPSNFRESQGTAASSEKWNPQCHGNESAALDNWAQYKDRKETQTACLPSLPGPDLPSLPGSVSSWKILPSNIYKSSGQAAHQTALSKKRTVSTLHSASMALPRGQSISPTPMGVTPCVSCGKSRSQDSRKNASPLEKATLASTAPQLILPRELNASTTRKNPLINTGDKVGQRNLTSHERRKSLTALRVAFGEEHSLMENTSHDQTFILGSDCLDRSIDSTFAILSKNSQDSSVSQSRMPKMTSASKQQTSLQVTLRNPDGFPSAFSSRMGSIPMRGNGATVPKQRRKLLVPEKAGVSRASNSSKAWKHFPVVSAKKVASSKTSKSKSSTKCPKLEKEIKKQNVSFGQSCSSIIYKLNDNCVFPFPPVGVCPATSASCQSPDEEKFFESNNLNSKLKNKGKPSYPKSPRTKYPALNVFTGKKKVSSGRRNIAKRPAAEKREISS